MDINLTDKKIAKMWRKGNKSLASIARKIGRPGNLERIQEGLVREGIWDSIKETK